MDIVNRIKTYLSFGGLYNPEMMDHNAVRDLVIDCRDEIERLREEIKDHVEGSQRIWTERNKIWDDRERLREAVLTGALMLSERGLSSAEKCEMAYNHLSAALKESE